MGGVVAPSLAPSQSPASPRTCSGVTSPLTLRTSRLPLAPILLATTSVVSVLPMEETSILARPSGLQATALMLPSRWAQALSRGCKRAKTVFRAPRWCLDPDAALVCKNTSRHLQHDLRGFTSLLLMAGAISA